MTTQELQDVQAGLAAIDLQLADLAAIGGRLGQEIKALREGLDGVLKLAAQAQREISAHDQREAEQAARQIRGA